MKASKIAVIVVGVILALLGTVFALQGDGVIGGSPLMDNNSSFIYIGLVVAIVGLVVIAFGLRISSAKPAAKTPQPEQSQKS